MMPVLRVMGMPMDVDQANLERLLGSLQKAICPHLGICPSEVSVFFPADLVSRGLGEELICVVEGLFDKPERAVAVRQRLASSLASELARFAGNHLPQCNKVEVIVNRFDQDTDGFATLNVQTPT